jgi:hypothetical protein
MHRTQLIDLFKLFVLWPVPDIAGRRVFEGGLVLGIALIALRFRRWPGCVCVRVCVSLPLGRRFVRRSWRLDRLGRRCGGGRRGERQEGICGLISDFASHLGDDLVCGLQVGEAAGFAGFFAFDQEADELCFEGDCCDFCAALFVGCCALSGGLCVGEQGIDGHVVASQSHCAQLL